MSRKASNTGLTIQPNSNQDPKAWIGVLKGALCRAYRLCSTPTHLKNEIDYLTRNFIDNGFKKKLVEDIVKSYAPTGQPPPPPPPPPPETTALPRLRPTAARQARQEQQQQQQQRRKPSHLSPT